MTRVEVAPLDAFEPGDRRLVTAGGTQVGVFNVDGNFYAVENACAHDGGPVCAGRVHGQLVADLDAETRRVTERVSDRPSVACPWHGWEYDLETGVHLGVDDVALATFDVVVEDGVVYLET